ncbi:MAG: aminoglycoside phosphotransferase family protein, partial [Actinobacteria bacterium]|nr:aminoglycoside phosphotransferase family protein [Actinomycetota bacterium]
MTEISPATLSWVSDQVGGRRKIISNAWMGSASTVMHAIDVLDDRGRVRRLAVRQYADVARLATDPWYRPQDEVIALEVLEQAGAPAPRLVAADCDPLFCVAPTLLETRVPGRPLTRRPRDMDSYLRASAELLRAIHVIDIANVARLQRYAPYKPPVDLKVPTWSRRRDLWTGVLEILSRPGPSVQEGFIHRDYHPGNILRSHGRISGAIDWPTACRGPFSIDLARMRLNLAGDFRL